MESSKDDFKWFGEGFDGFPKTLPEDCMQYSIYLIDSLLGDREIREKLREIQIAAGQLTKKLLRDFIWQREGFKLNLEQENGRTVLKGQTNYGDSVEDEWLIVFILHELSKQFQSAWVQVVDSDGQFLLIEAANSLPLWLNPEVADNRVWINDGKLLLIPIDNPGGRTRRAHNASDTLDLKVALQKIESPTAKLQRSIKVETEAFYRLQKYPQQIADNLHNSLIKVPRKLAYVLHDNPKYISPAIEAFYLRDPIALRPLQAKDGSKLLFPPEDLVTVSASFNKIGFAQLKSQHFLAPLTWAVASKAKGDAKAKARMEMGMKVTCGFEMLVSDPQNRDKQAYREIHMLLDDVLAGDAHLPTDEDILEWSLKADDENWLDIDFNDFEKELNKENRPKNPTDGFGDQKVQDNLRKIVSRFEDFLDDDDAGAEGAELMDEMDHDNDSSEVSKSEESEDNGEETKSLSFDEDEFTSMMREMMEMPPGVMSEMMGKAKAMQTYGQAKAALQPKPGQLKSRSETLQQQEDDGIQESMNQIEQELRDAGALDLEPQSQDANRMTSPSRIIKLDSSSVDGTGDESHQESTTADSHIADVEKNLVSNLLESFKSQGGAAGPGGNLMGLMGMHLPRDEHGED